MTGAPLAIDEALQYRLDLAILRPHRLLVYHKHNIGQMAVEVSENVIFIGGSEAIFVSHQ